MPSSVGGLSNGIDAPKANRDRSDSTTDFDGGWMRLKGLSDEQRKGRYIAGTVYGVCVLLVGHQAGAMPRANADLVQTLRASTMAHPGR